MLLFVSAALAVCEGPEVAAWIPRDGELRKTSWVRARTGAEFPEAELHSKLDEAYVYVLTETLGDTETPRDWVAWQLDEDLYDDDYELVVYDAGTEVGRQDLVVFEFAEIGVLGEGLAWVDTSIDPTDYNPDLCSTELEAAWHLVTVTFESPEAPGNGWLVEVADGSPVAWAEMPEFGGEVTASYYVHWTEEETCPEVRVRDPFHEIQDRVGGDCLILPDVPGEGDRDDPRFDVACGCGPGPAPAAPLALIALVALRRRRA